MRAILIAGYELAEMVRADVDLSASVPAVGDTARRAISDTFPLASVPLSASGRGSSAETPSPDISEQLTRAGTPVLAVGGA